VDLVHQTASGVDVVPSSTWLASVDKALAGEVGAELLFQKALRRLPDRWDFVLVDCQPALGLLTVAALAACREALIPVEAHVMALAGLASLMQTVEVVRDRLNPSLEVSAIVACRADTRTRLAQDVEAHLRERFGPLVLKTVVRESVRLAEAPSFAQPITVYDPHGHGAEDYRAVAKELLKKGRS
jgi:chromosome partitioning protein